MLNSYDITRANIILCRIYYCTFIIHGTGIGKLALYAHSHLNIFVEVCHMEVCHMEVCHMEVCLHNIISNVSVT